MTPEEKLERVRELLEEEKAIKAELLELVGGDTEEEEEEEEPAPAPKKRAYKKRKVAKTKRTVTCKKCGNEGHLAKTCPVQKPFVPVEELTPTGTAQGVTRSNGRTILDKPLRLTETEYNEVAEQIGDGLTNEMIAFSYPHVEIAEIRRASISDNYEDYLK